jgi:hypothetical protein
MLPRPRCPWWFVWLVAVALALCLRALLPASATAPGDALPQLAFWQFIVAIAGAIWKGLEVAGRVALQILTWSVQQLWVFATTVYNAVKRVGSAFAIVGRKVWNFLEATYDHVLKPAWTKFWHWFDRFRRWLEDVARPIFKFLRTVHDVLLKFYTHFIRPILDFLDLTRGVLRTLGTFGLKWARTLDRKLADIEDKIDRPFRLVMAKVNEIINLVNRVVTADGLFQRVALMRSIARDYRLVYNTLVNSFSHPLTAGDLDDLEKDKPDAAAVRLAPFHQFVDTSDGPWAPTIHELVQIALQEATLLRR